ncbi:MAG TPA: hypothetical protein VGX23_01045 [Actinocrinis sp.]|nr:hypothetical protein [Actinocrinis sp.]
MIRRAAVAEEAINGNAVTANTYLDTVSNAVPEVSLRLVGALLALAVAAVHVADQGGVGAFDSPDWLGWAYRLIEAGGVLTALALLAPRTSRLGWAAAVLLGAGPFLGYLASRTVGVPGDPDDVGNWADWVGTVSLLLEAALIVLAATMARAGRPEPAPRTLRTLTAADLLAAKPRR